MPRRSFRRRDHRAGFPLWVRAMAYEPVSGYCWPQSSEPGGRVGLHLSSAGGRPVSVEVARIAQHREVVFRIRSSSWATIRLRSAPTAMAATGRSLPNCRSRSTGAAATTRCCSRSTSTGVVDRATPSSWFGHESAPQPPQLCSRCRPTNDCRDGGWPVRGASWSDTGTSHLSR